MESRGIGPQLRLAVGAAALLLLSSCSAPATQPAITPTPTVIPNASSTLALGLGCTEVETAPTPVPADLLDIANSDDPILGPADAAVTMLVYCDLQSAECEIFNRVLDELLQNHGTDLRVIYRLFPVPESAIPSLDKSVLAAQAAVAAEQQGRFWEMRDLLHSQYDDWISLAKIDFRNWLLREAPSIGLDPVGFASDLDSAETLAKAESAYQSAVALGISSIPTVFINGQLQQRAALSYSGLDSTISLLVLGGRQFRSCPPVVIDPARQYLATLHTSKGDIVIALDSNVAPLAVNSFVFLAQQGWYDGTSFHRVIPGFVAQGGDPSGTGRGGPGYYFLNEVVEAARFDKPGVVGMANSGPDTNGSQFFITFAPQPLLDGSYTVFGHVVEGMEVVESLTPRDPDATANPAPGDRILSITVEVQ